MWVAGLISYAVVGVLVVSALSRTYGKIDGDSKVVLGMFWPIFAVFLLAPRFRDDNEGE